MLNVIEKDIRNSNIFFMDTHSNFECVSNARERIFVGLGATRERNLKEHLNMTEDNKY